VARYAYDVLGRRIVKRVYGGANAGYLRMIYAGDAVAAEADSGGTRSSPEPCVEVEEAPGRRDHAA
jgi:hypothetical protein